MDIVLVAEMNMLLDQINAVMTEGTADRFLVERTLTDGYAHALTLESERLRMQKRVEELMLRRDTETNTKELRLLAKELDGNASDLEKLRRVLAELRRSAA
jgi:predicted RNase H-like nuclease (RuvC/YqgF family)